MTKKEHSKSNDTSYLVNCFDGVSLEKVFTFVDIGLSPRRPVLETVLLSVNNKCNHISITSFL